MLDYFELPAAKELREKRERGVRKALKVEEWIVFGGVLVMVLALSAVIAFG